MLVLGATAVIRQANPAAPRPPLSRGQALLLNLLTRTPKKRAAVALAKRWRWPTRWPASSGPMLVSGKLDRAPQAA